MATKITRELVDEDCRSKALLRYKIKQSESKLERLLSRGSERHLIAGDVVAVCTDLNQRYGELLELMNGIPLELSQPQCLHSAENWLLCYQEVKFLQRRLYSFHVLKEIEIINALREQYRCLVSFASCDCIQKSESFKQSVLPREMEPLVRASYPEEWLQAMVRFANQQSGIHPQDFLSHLTALSNQELKEIAKCFYQPAYLDLINAIFFYKLHPQQLFHKIPHPEKLISIKTRLSLLHHFIEMFHYTLGQILVQKGLPAIQDRLFHNEDLPQGIQINFNEKSRALIAEAIKAWRCHSTATEHTNSTNHLKELFRAYKYWFNPSRLIDGVMNLMQQLSNHEESFVQQVRQHYSRLTTTECLDLYGYFSNKDSNYLMRTLLAAMLSDNLSWLPAINNREKKAIQRVYNALDDVMNALRSELESRRITTASFKREASEKIITPGRRNRNAVQRIITLYCKEETAPGTQVDALFKEMEAKTD